MERHNDKMLNNAALLFLVAAIGIILIQWMMSPTYKNTTAHVHAAMLSDDMLLLPYQLKQMYDDGSIADYTLVYLGDQESEIPGFQNQLAVPLADLLMKKNLNALKAQKQLIVLGDEETQAMIAAQLLVAQGIENIQVAALDRDFLINETLSGLAPDKYESHDEKAGFNYVLFFKNESDGTAKRKSNAILPDTQIEIKPIAGGC
ncbi:MAG: hypothetical protein M0Q41_07075 [Bacteroidales bacterium]|nr:hypothetical protein [Bacteroidales bacterium]